MYDPSNHPEGYNPTNEFIGKVFKFIGKTILILGAIAMVIAMIGAAVALAWRWGIILAPVALIVGALWAIYKWADNNSPDPR